MHLSTARLLLRPLEAGDTEALFGYRSLPEVARYQSWENFSRADAALLIDEQRESKFGVPGTWLQLAIVEAATGSMIGDCGLHCLPTEPEQIESDISLAPSHQGRGYAAEALTKVLEMIFGTFSKHRVNGRCRCGECCVGGALPTAGISPGSMLGRASVV